MTTTTAALPTTGWLREKQILGDKKLGIAPLIPISRASWWRGVKAGRYPKPLKPSPRTTVWRVEDIRRLLENGAV